MRKRAFKKLAALFVVAVFVLTMFAVAGAADELGGFNNGGTGAVLSRSDEQAKSGTKSLKIVPDTDSPAGYKGSWGKIDLLPYLTDENATYEIHFSLFQNVSDSATFTATLNLQRGTDGDKYLNYVAGAINGYQQPFTKGTWVDRVYTIDMTDSANFSSGEIKKATFWFEEISASPFYVDDFKVIKKGATAAQDEVLLDLNFDGEVEPPTPEEFTYDFEDGLQGWEGDGGVTLEHETEFVGKGKGALKAILQAGRTEYNIFGPLDKVDNGNTFKCVIYIPDGVDVNGIQIFSQDSDWTWSSAWTNGETGKWLAMSYTIPAADAMNNEGKTIGEKPFQKFGIQILLHSALTQDTAIYIDSAYEEEEEPPQTGDFGTLGFVLLAAASGAVLVLRKRK